jgi:3'-5' exoribonuclease
MTRRFVKELGDGESFDQVFLASEKQLRPNRQGNLYLQVRLSDRTGSMTAMLWNAEQRDFERFNNGDFVRVKGTAQLYNGGMQIIAKYFEQVDSSGVEEGDFITLATQELDEMVSEVSGMLRGMKNFPLRNLAECFLVDDTIMNKLRRAPAGVKNHHAYQGGLLQHVTSLMRLAAATTPLYDNVNDDIVLMGAFLHDIGKIDELTYSPDLGYSDSGQLIGHLIQGVGILEKKIEETDRQSDEAFPEDLALHLKHMIVSHHGPAEYGSPKVPMTLEAVMLHYLDNIDAKMATITQLIEEDANPNSRWTVYHPHMGRKIFKGSPKS